MNDLTIIHYTSNWLEDHNPHFLKNTQAQLLKAIGDKPMIIVSQKPTMFGPNSTNVCLGDIGRSHFNIYWQILQGCKAAKTKFVAMAEDDILYSEPHFNFHYFVKPEMLNKQVFFYDMNKVSMFTWTKPPMFSFRSHRMVVNQLIAPRQMLIDAMEERFERLIELEKKGWSVEKIMKYWADPGRYEDHLGVTVRPRHEYYSWIPSIVFTHECAFGFLNHGKKKKLGDMRIIELADWGRAEEVLKLFYKPGQSFPL